MPGREATDAFFVARRMQEEYRDKKKKLYMCFANIEMAFDKSSKKDDEVSDEKKRFTGSNRKHGDESITGQKRKFEWDLSYLRNS